MNEHPARPEPLENPVHPAGQNNEGVLTDAGGQSNVLGPIEPQPPRGIKYMLGNESWLPVEQRSPLHLHCEEWGNLGPMELDRTIQDNGHGFRVRTTDFAAPAGAGGFTEVGGIYYWTRLKG